jgi:hypothetical protein
VSGSRHFLLTLRTTNPLAVVLLVVVIELQQVMGQCILFHCQAAIGQSKSFVVVENLMFRLFMRTLRKNKINKRERERESNLYNGKDKLSKFMSYLHY